MSLERMRHTRVSENAGDELNSVDDLLEMLPAEHHETWMQKIAGKEAKEQKAILRNGIQKRAEAVKPADHKSEYLRIAKELPRELIARMRDIDRHSEEINRGQNGRIIRCRQQDPTRPAVVYKVLLHPPMPPHNSLRSEAAFQADVHRLSLDHPEIRVSVPRPFFFTSKLGIEAIAQEEVTNCIAVKDIIDQDIPIPPELDISAIFAEVQRFVDCMHEKGFYHRDLREGNIMVNLDPDARDDEPLAYVIDMGYCTRAWSEEEAYRRLDAPKDNVILKKVKEMLVHRREIQQERS